MQLTDDSALLRQFAENQSDEAFGALVTRHINLVYSVALRQLGQPHQAEEITQAVFIILAKKAAGIRHERALTGWLFKTTRLTANSFIRGEMRRRHREQEAYMQSVLDEPAHDAWPEIAPLLDDAVGSLREKDRQAILLRFYEGRHLREIGPVLGVSEDAAEKRVSRALEKLRRFFARRGVHSTTAIIGETISSNSVQAAPMALAKTVGAIAVAKGAGTSISTLTLIKGALKIMAWTKAKTTIAAAAAVLLIGGSIPAVKIIHSSVLNHRGGVALNRMIEANRCWLVTPPKAVTSYTCVFHSDIMSPRTIQVANPQTVSGAERQGIDYFSFPNPQIISRAERQGITYSSVLQYLARNPECAQIQHIKNEGGKITLDINIRYAPGEKSFLMHSGKKVPLGPLHVSYGNGINGWHGDFSLPGWTAQLVLDENKMVPLSAIVRDEKGRAAVEESFADYTELAPGQYAPLKIAIKGPTISFPKWVRGRPVTEKIEMQFAWQFKIHDGLWLFDEGEFNGQKVAWTDQVAVN